MGACFLQIGRRQIHSDAADREFGTTGFDGGADALAGFPHGSIRQTYHVKGGQSAGEETLGANFVSGYSVEPQRTNGNDHTEAFFLVLQKTAFFCGDVFCELRKFYHKFENTGMPTDEKMTKNGKKIWSNRRKGENCLKNNKVFVYT